MAESMIQKWRLAVLRVRLDVRSRTPRVVCDLEGYPGGERRTFWERTYPLEAFGLAHTFVPPTRLTCPEDLRDAIRETLATQLEEEAALWLRLVPPYGFLGAVPWEESLIDATGLPVLRIPDRLPVPTEPGSTWTMAVAVDASLGSTWAPDHVIGLLENLPRKLDVPLEVDLFCDADTRAAVLARLPSSTAAWVRVHDPADASRASTQRAARAAPPYPDPRSPGASARTQAVRFSTPGLRWGDWIVECLEGRAVRALHIACEAIFDGGRPLLAVSPDPADVTPLRASAYVCDDDVCRLADRVGAPTLSFGSPPGRSSDAAMRVLADLIGQQRPGPTWYSSLTLDPHVSWLASAFAFLANEEPGVGVPRHPSLFAYLQPEQVRNYLIDPWPDVTAPDDVAAAVGALPDSSVLPLPLQESEVLAQLQEDADVVPTWLAASERFVDTGVAELLQSSSPLRRAVPENQSYFDAAAHALGELRELIARHAESSS